MCGPRLRAPISPGDVGTETPGWRCGARWGGGSRRDLGTQLPHPARSTCPPCGAVWDGDVAHRPRGMHGGDVRGSGAPMVHGGERCCAVGTVPQSVPAGGVRCARGGGGTEEGRGPRPGLQSQQCPVFPRRGRTCLPPAAARLECGVGAPTWGLQPPPIPPGCVRGPRGLPLLPPVLPLPRSSAGPLSLSLPYFSCHDGGGGGGIKWGGMRRAIRSPGAVGPLPLPPSPRCCR